MTAQPVHDVQAHMRQRDLAGKPAKEPSEGAKSAGAPARARVIQLRPDLRQDATPIIEPDVSPAEQTQQGGLGASLLAEMQAAQAAAREEAEDSELAQPAMTVLQAFEQVAPAKGEAPNKTTWVAMTLAGVLRVLIVGAGNLLAAGGSTRIRAAVTSTVLVTALTLSWLLGHAA